MRLLARRELARRSASRTAFAVPVGGRLAFKFLTCLGIAKVGTLEIPRRG
jgi:hypothetical protein